MSHLDKEHPDVYNYLMSGGFSVQVGADNPFGKVPVDQTCEETVNKDTQTSGGTKGCSLKPGAVSRFYMVAEYRSMYLGNVHEMLHLKSFFNHSDLQIKRIKKDEADVKSLVEMLETSWIVPFSFEIQDLVCLSTRKAVPSDVEKDLLDAKDKGEAAFKKFSRK